MEGAAGRHRCRSLRKLVEASLVGDASPCATAWTGGWPRAEPRALPLALGGGHARSAARRIRWTAGPDASGNEPGQGTLRRGVRGLKWSRLLWLRPSPQLNRPRLLWLRCYVERAGMRAARARPRLDRPEAGWGEGGDGAVRGQGNAQPPMPLGKGGEGTGGGGGERAPFTTPGARSAAAVRTCHCPCASTACTCRILAREKPPAMTWYQTVEQPR